MTDHLRLLASAIVIAPWLACIPFLGRLWSGSSIGLAAVIIIPIVIVVGSAWAA